MRILLVEDNLELSKLLSAYLECHFIVDTVSKFKDACDYIDLFTYNVVLLDRNLDDEDIGMNLIVKIKTKDYMTGVIVISAFDSTADKVLGLDMGADDYLEKPFDNDELRARVCALGRRHQTLPRIEINNLVCDTLSKRISFQDKEVLLSKKETDLFFYLLEHRGKIVPKDELLNALYINPQNISSNTIDVTLAHVRKKLPIALIKTVKTRGYIID
ncbi:MAG: hypothetical protein COA44_07195 [Arcobacter sp.]|nr:MAG: hypothetical protein COA44_07195 [Arcobacter sp.]